MLQAGKLNRKAKAYVRRIFQRKPPVTELCDFLLYWQQIPQIQACGGLSFLRQPPVFRKLFVCLLFSQQTKAASVLSSSLKLRRKMQALNPFSSLLTLRRMQALNPLSSLPTLRKMQALNPLSFLLTTRSLALPFPKIPHLLLSVSVRPSSPGKTLPQQPPASGAALQQQPVSGTVLRQTLYLLCEPVFPLWLYLASGTISPLRPFLAFEPVFLLKAPLAFEPVFRLTPLLASGPAFRLTPLLAFEPAFRLTACLPSGTKPPF